jgi:hypothetical protein
MLRVLDEVREPPRVELEDDDVRFGGQDEPPRLVRARGGDVRGADDEHGRGRRRVRQPLRARLGGGQRALGVALGVAVEREANHGRPAVGSLDRDPLGHRRRGRRRVRVRGVVHLASVRRLRDARRARGDVVVVLSDTREGRKNGTRTRRRDAAARAIIVHDEAVSRIIRATTRARTLGLSVS